MGSKIFSGFVGGTAIGTVIGDTTNGLILGIMLGTAFAKFTFMLWQKNRNPKSQYIEYGRGMIPKRRLKRRK